MFSVSQVSQAVVNAVNADDFGLNLRDVTGAVNWALGVSVPRAAVAAVADELVAEGAFVAVSNVVGSVFFRSNVEAARRFAAAASDLALAA